MKLGVVFPQTEIGNDPLAIRDFAQAAEQLGYNHLLAYEHVLGAPPERLEGLGFRPPYTHKTPFHEPFVLFGYLAGLTTNLELVTGILVLPQRSVRFFSNVKHLSLGVREYMEKRLTRRLVLCFPMG